MKQLLFSCLIIGTTLTACSKKNTDTPITNNNQTSTMIITIPDSVTIGTQTWTSVNYSGPGGLNYNNATVTNPNWGKLFTNDEAAALKIPKPWRLPTTDDYNKLMKFVGAIGKDDVGNYLLSSTEAVKLMSKTTWLVNIGINSTGFNAFPAGYEGDGGGPDFHDASGYSSTDITTVFATSSAYTGPRGGKANFSINQNTLSANLFTGGGISSYSPVGGISSSRTSIRFVRDN